MAERYLNKDILTNIFNYLQDIDKINFLSTCQTFNQLKNLFTFDELINIKKILHVSYRKSFTNVFIGKLEFIEFFDDINYYFEKISIKIDKNFLTPCKK